MTQALFYVFAITAIAAAVLSISRKNAVASALWLVLMFFGLAGIYVLLEAYFVAAIQILVYAGAIMVLFLFVIMLLDLRSDELANLGPPRFRFFGLLAAAAFLALAVGVVTQSEPPTPRGWAAHPDGLLFPDLRDLCALTDGNLARHLQALRGAELIEVWKRSRATLCRLSEIGRA